MITVIKEERDKKCVEVISLRPGDTFKYKDEYYLVTEVDTSDPDLDEDVELYNIFVRLSEGNNVHIADKQLVEKVDLILTVES